MILASLPSSKIILGLVAAGWLATALANTNSDIEAGIQAYEAGDSEAALLAYAAAEEALGERSEIHFNRGLALLAKDDLEPARKAFEHGSESEHEGVRASAEYELGNLDFDAEAWDAAIPHYIACLKIDADHASAKWNLELARLRKKEQEEEQEKDKDDEQKDDEQKDDEQKDDEQNDDEQNDDEQNDDEQKDDEQKDDEQKDDEQKDDEQKDDEQKDEPKQDDEQKDEPKQDEPKQDEQQQPQPVERADLDKALEELDSQDNFFLGKPQGQSRPVEKDW